MSLITSAHRGSELAQQQLMGGVSNDSELVKHVPQTRQSSRLESVQPEPQIRSPLRDPPPHSCRHSPPQGGVSVGLCCCGEPLLNRRRSRPFGMDAAEGSVPVSRLERSSHTAFIDNNTLYVWGGYQVRNVYLRRYICEEINKSPSPLSVLNVSSSYSTTLYNDTLKRAVYLFF